MKNEQKPMVSIVCEVFNHEKFLRQCLDGFLMQKTYFSYEILIHDDASTDGSQQIILEYTKKNPDTIKPILQKDNQYSQGVCIWRTIQFPRAQGKYIAFCEGDDCWTDPNKLQKQVDFLESHSDYTMCFHNVTEHFEDGSKPDRLHWNVENRDYTDLEIFSHWIIQTASVVMRTNVIQNDIFKKMFCEVVPLNGDISLFVVCAMSGKVYGMDRVMSLYRRHNNNLSSDFSDLESMSEEANYYLRFYKVFGGRFKEVCIKAFVRNYTSIFIYSRQHHKPNWQFLTTAIKTAPLYTIRCILESAKASIKRRLRSTLHNHATL